MLQKKICMIGAPGVGKTSLVRRYVESVFSERYHSTLGVKIDKKTVVVDGREVTLLLWDIAGVDDSAPLPVAYVRGAAGYLLVVDGTRRDTLATAEHLQREVADATGGAPFRVVLNKADLAEAWCVGDSEALLAERGWNGCETSAKDGTGVESAFVEIARLTLRD